MIAEPKMSRLTKKVDAFMNRSGREEPGGVRRPMHEVAETVVPTSTRRPGVPGGAASWNG